MNVANSTILDMGANSVQQIQPDVHTFVQLVLSVSTLVVFTLLSAGHLSFGNT